VFANFLPNGSSAHCTTDGYRQRALIQNDVICLGQNRANLCLSGARTHGLLLKKEKGESTIIITDSSVIRNGIPTVAVGFNGIVGTGWDAGYQNLMLYRLSGGAPSGGMPAE
jgi:hypothetical protein